MKQSLKSTKRQATERATLRRRLKQFYAQLNEANWDSCFGLIDPELGRLGKVDLAKYAEGLQEFMAVYGRVDPWFIRISLHLDAAQAQRDKRPFAYVYVLWQDAAHEFHMFRERWIKDNGHWFTRVVGLVPNRREGAA